MQANSISALQTFPLIAILRGLERHRAVDVGACLIEQGFTTLEVPLSTEDALAAIDALAQNFSNSAAIGAGTVLNTQQVKQITDVGAQFAISPNTNAEVIRLTKQQQLLSIPGCMTPSEAILAIESGADALKLFPAHSLSAAACKAIIKILPKSLPIFVVGGVANSGMADYLKAGACGFGIGASLFTPDMNLASIERQAKLIIDAFKSAEGSI
ncbi:2-dehydro-3-deoxy-6-phosphogalactonate aldolase [Agarilytica rhodophyticola]|uniref:2-dehydro-3-deoxy-6-phosphogalactonate aldolase n=1 Tax=Agarilytica rhodophyticola TaxID=1737490 RepID=UPI000B347E34|nr:2-dehydro-3-deoxy-6-phosphogalactonate aldolase [Agarilytica rhodophyticola]